MAFSTIDVVTPLATSVSVNDDTLGVGLSDGRTIAVPLAWYPRLSHGTPAERDNWHIIANGEGIHWPDLDEDISVAALLAGRRSLESEKSLGKWLKARTRS